MRCSNIRNLKNWYLQKSEMFLSTFQDDLVSEIRLYTTSCLITIIQKCYVIKRMTRLLLTQLFEIFDLCLFIISAEKICNFISIELHGCGHKVWLKTRYANKRIQYTFFVYHTYFFYYSSTSKQKLYRNYKFFINSVSTEFQ